MTSPRHTPPHGLDVAPGWTPWRHTHQLSHEWISAERKGERLLRLDLDRGIWTCCVIAPEGVRPAITSMHHSVHGGTWAEAVDAALASMAPPAPERPEEPGLWHACDDCGEAMPATHLRPTGLGRLCDECAP